jgi:hypothetical protein
MAPPHAPAAYDRQAYRLIHMRKHSRPNGRGGLPGGQLPRSWLIAISDDITLVTMSNTVTRITIVRHEFFIVVVDNA